MKPIKFKEANQVIAKSQPQYKPIAVLRTGDDNGEVISCWKLSFADRLRALFFGRVWMSLMTFNKPLTPSLLTTRKSELSYLLKLREKDFIWRYNAQEERHEWSGPRYKKEEDRFLFWSKASNVMEAEGNFRLWIKEHNNPGDPNLEA